MNKKKILILGGSDIQVSAIKMAREMGYYVITCDYLPNNPGHQFSHEYHNVSTTEKEKVLALAKKLNIDGVLAYASDPASLTAAYVGEKLNLPSNTYKAVKIMSRKDLFRRKMKELGFLVPQADSFTSYEKAFEFVQQLGKTCIIKPVDSSGSKGIYRIEKGDNFESEFNAALSFSREKRIIVEEFIEKKGYQIGGDGFLVDGKLVFRCFGDIHFSKTNPLLPCSVSIPTLHSKELIEKVHETIQQLLAQIGMKVGALNFDVIVDENDSIYILEIGARNGGNMIPELTKYCTGVDMIEYSIKAAMGEDISDLKMTYEKPYFSHYVIHAAATGVVTNIKKSKRLQKCLLYEHYNFKIGEEVSKFESSANRLGMMLLKYPDKEVMLDLIKNMDEDLIFQIQ